MIELKLQLAEQVEEEVEGIRWVWEDGEGGSVREGGDKEKNHGPSLDET